MTGVRPARQPGSESRRTSPVRAEGQPSKQRGRLHRFSVPQADHPCHEVVRPRARVPYQPGDHQVPVDLEPEHAAAPSRHRREVAGDDAFRSTRPCVMSSTAPPAAGRQRTTDHYWSGGLCRHPTPGSGERSRSACCGHQQCAHGARPPDGSMSTLIPVNPASSKTFTQTCSWSTHRFIVVASPRESLPVQRRPRHRAARERRLRSAQGWRTPAVRPA